MVRGENNFPHRDKERSAKKGRTHGASALACMGKSISILSGKIAFCIFKAHNVVVPLSDKDFYEHAKQCESTSRFCLPFFLSSGHLVEYSTEEARGVLDHRLLRPLSSELRSEVTSEVTGSLGGHFYRKSNSNGINSQLGITPSFLSA